MMSMISRMKVRTAPNIISHVNQIRSVNIVAKPCSVKYIMTLARCERKKTVARLQKENSAPYVEYGDVSEEEIRRLRPGARLPVK